MKNFDYDLFIQKVIEKLYEIDNLDQKKFKDCKDGVEFENIVLEAVTAVKNEYDFEYEISYEQGSHRFPDIVVDFGDFGKYGIEVKCSTDIKKNNWTINGNSILGSTKDKEVKETYIIFGKPLKHEFKAREYKKCIKDIRVTHSPRYLVDMELPEGNDFFTSTGIDYVNFSSSENRIDLITEYYRKEGKTAWWVSQNTSATVIFWSTLEKAEKAKIISQGFVNFPEVIIGDYKRFGEWLAVSQGIVTNSLRDIFSASGRVEFMLDSETAIEYPHVFIVLKNHIKKIKQILREFGSDAKTVEELHQYWEFIDRKFNKKEELFLQWKSVLNNQLKNKYPSEYNNMEKFINKLV